ncbi:MAG TPA: DUF99 family protein [Terriglobales bacterium]|nr:DUF99 family protein [Terriglobales bacterium]
MPKREIRILALNLAQTKYKLIVVGVVFRGNRWLDGIVSGLVEAKGQERTQEIARIVRRSRQFTQLHAIMLAENAADFDCHPTQLAKSLSVPVIMPSVQCSESSLIQEQSTVSFNFRLAGEDVSFVATGIGVEEAKEVLAVSTKPGSRKPEATRVAELLMRELKFTLNSED